MGNGCWRSVFSGPYNRVRPYMLNLYGEHTGGDLNSLLRETRMWWH